MFCARKDEKLLPASVVNDALAEKVTEIEQQQARKISRKEKAQFKDDVIAALLPRAFSRTRRIHAYLALHDNLLIVNTSSDEIKAHLLAGKQVKKLGLVWNDTLSCVIAADLAVTRLKFEDMILERAQETDAESEGQQFDQDFAIMSLEISRLLKSLLAVFGGLSEVEAGVVAGPRKADQVSGHY